MVAWQNNQMSSEATKSTSLGATLEKLSSIGFSDQAANEGVPREKQFKLMQNHLKVVEQRAQAKPEEKRLAEQLAQQEAELASFKRQSVTRSAS